MNKPEEKSYTGEDITFCMDDCDNMECIRNKIRPKMKTYNSYAFLKNTDYCPLSSKENK